MVVMEDMEEVTEEVMEDMVGIAEDMEVLVDMEVVMGMEGDIDISYLIFLFEISSFSLFVYYLILILM